MSTIALFGAGGKMGCRLIDNLKHSIDYRMLYLETGEAGLQQLAERGLSVTSQEAAVPEADVVILALPDAALGSVSFRVVPKMKSGAILMTLNPAAAFAGALATRYDVARFVAHPCHPPIWNDEEGAARRDFFGGVAAKQSVVCAFEGGSEADFELCEGLVREMFAPVMRVHRITVEQMAILEPTMSETITAMLCTVIRDSMVEAVRRGVPREAAEDFMLGHVNSALAISFGMVDSPFSDGAKRMIAYGRERILHPQWEQLFEPESIRDQVRTILE